ncbi:hypothetical protein SP6_30_01700 [Sphingomonas paucimobilis NBRC 13935]|uniref:DNA, contig: SP630 n=1 Tax=Sphingomonas paucimobilis NBRC 13935 TaxID=1219050 RepID=A0A0C9N341_SPHPI|nr:hypothetical protein SP6_30_01700 [Sphingomonas paucimobilis NBRC 13935]
MLKPDRYSPNTPVRVVGSLRGSGAGSGDQQGAARCNLMGDVVLWCDADLFGSCPLRDMVTPQAPDPNDAGM